MKIPRHLRLAYICKVLTKRIEEGTDTYSDRVRQRKLFYQLGLEASMWEFQGFLVNSKAIRVQGGQNHA
jgi:hypothetical protein